MAFKISITAAAKRQFQALPARDQRILTAAISVRLRYEPTKSTKAIRRMRPNPLVEYELRVRDLRVLYNVEAGDVIVVVIGRKVGNILMVEGEEFHGYQDDPA